MHGMFDEFGPEKIIEVYNAKVGMKGLVVLDNSALGPCKGGIRMTPTVSKEEVFRLARTMTWKNALANLPFGGGKSGIIADPRHINDKKKKAIIEAFADALKVVSPSQYVAAPDINMGEKEMGWYYKKNGDKKSVTGKPKKMGGIPHELGSTGFGVYHSLLIAVKYAKLNANKSTVAIEGFGNVGWFIAKYLSECCKSIVAVSDSKGVIYNKDGLDFDRLVQVKKKEGTVTAYKPGQVLPTNSILDVKADILITAAVPDLIKEGDVDRLKFKMIVEGSNIPMTEAVERLVHKKGITVVPDFVANAGGVISSYVEYIGGSEKKMFSLVESKITKNTQEVLSLARKKRASPRDAAMEIAIKRVRKYCRTCRVWIWIGL